MTWTCCAPARWAGLFTGVRAPSTLGTFLRRVAFGHVRQPDAVAATMLGRLAARSPLLAGRCPAMGELEIPEIIGNSRRVC